MKTLKEIGDTYLAWDQQREYVTSEEFKILHIASEVAEVFECLRKKEANLYFNGDNNMKPEGWGPELADIIILTAKLAAYRGIDLDRMIKLKHAYNLTRPKGTKKS